MKWIRLADLPVAMYGAYVAIQDKKIYIAGGNCPMNDVLHHVFVYDTDCNKWDKLPSPDQYCTIPHIIGWKLALIGGCLLSTKMRTNKVSTFNETNQTWISYYPNLLSARNRPGVTTYEKHVIVAGGTRGDHASPVVLDDIEILNWTEISEWKRLSIHLPEPMCAFAPTVFDDRLFIVGYTDARMCLNTHVYEIPITFLKKSNSSASKKSAKWVKLVKATYWRANLVNGLSSLVVIGGHNAAGTTTADISIYDKVWKKIDALSFARSSVAVSAINNNAIIVIGGCTKEGSVDDAMSTCLTTVELGQFVKS